MKFTEVLKQQYQDIIQLRTILAEPILSADKIARTNTFVTQYCEHAKQFKIVINAAQIIINPSKPVSHEQLQNIFTVFDYVCYLDTYLAEDNPHKDFFLRPIHPEFRSNSLVKRDLVLKIQSYLNKILYQITPENPKLQTYLSLFDEALTISRTLTFDPSSIDDFITNALIKLMLISFIIDLVDLDICATDSIFATLESDRTGLLQLLTEISTRLLPAASTSSIFNTCFNNHYYGLGITEYEQLRAKAIELTNVLDELIQEHAPVRGSEEAAPIAKSDGGGIDDSPIIVAQPAPVEVPVPRPRTPVDKINTTANPLLQHSPIPFPSPGSDVPTPLYYCVDGGTGVQWTPPRHGTDTSHLNISTPNTGCSSRHPLMYSPADSAGLSLLSTPGTGDRSIIGSSSLASPADAFGAVRKKLLPYSKQLREQGPGVSCLDLDASAEVNPADLSGVVDPRDSSGLADPADVPAIIPGHSAGAAADLRTNTNGRRL